LHVNGVTEVSMALGAFDTAARSCSNTGADCHFDARVTW
jgi:hypothetical protein